MKREFLLTPPMGWNSYDYYDTTVTEEDIRKNADFMAANLKQYGYEYIVVDIEWYSNDAGIKRDKYQYIPFGDDEMDDYGRFLPAPGRFPSSKGGNGFKPLADYVHSLGLKFGIHIMRGIPRAAAEKHLPVLGTSVTAAEVADPNSICIWNPDMYGVRNTPEGQAYYDSIISMYADWGVDFIKCDDICDSRLYRDEALNGPFSGWHETEMIHKAIIKTGRDIVLSLSPGPAHIDKSWFYRENANMWRITDDFWDDFALLKNMFYRCEMWQDHVGAGSYPDCDMLPVGTLGGGFGGDPWKSHFSKDELQTMMTLWCIFRSPLMIGGELTKMTDYDLSFLTNKNILEMSGKCRRGRQLRLTENEAVWASVDVEDGDKIKAYAFFNLSDTEREISFKLSAESPETITAMEGWSGEKCTFTGGLVKAKVPAHGVKVFVIE